MFKNHFKIALRALMRAKSYTALNVFGLAVGLTCVSLIAAWSFDELSFDRFHQKHERIYRVVGQVKTDSETFDQAVTSPPMAQALVQDFPEIENAVRLDMNDCIVRNGDVQFEEDGVLMADQSFFEIFDYPLVQGEIATALSAPYSVVLTESIAKKYFGDENPVGQNITLFQYDPEGRGAPYQITGIVADPPENAHFSFTMLGSFKTIETASPRMAQSWFDNGFFTYLLLKDGANASALEQKLPQFAERYMGEKMREYKMFYTYSLQSLADVYLHSNLRYEIGATGSMNTVYIFVTVGVFILLIACINYMNLATARSLGRAREVGVKKVLGAERSQLVRQFLVESTLVAMVSFVLALFFTELLQSPFFELTGKQLDRVFSMELLLLISGITLFIGVLSGLYPAFFISRFAAAAVLKGSFKTSKAGVFMRESLVIVQFAIAIVLLSGVAVVKSQMDFIKSKDLGFDKDALLLLKVNGFAEVQNEFQPFKNALLADPAISGVTRSRGLIAGGLGNVLIETVDGEGRPVSSSIYRLQVDPDFLDVYKIELLAGRDLTEADSMGAYIVNESAVQAFGWGEPQNAPGKPFARDRPGAVIGVVQDFHFNSLQQSIAPMEFHLTRPNAFSRISIRLETANLAETVAFVEQTWREHFPAALFQHSFFDQRLENQYRQEKLFGDIFSAFVIISLTIACLGLLGLSAFAAEQRTKEIGVRKTLGATVPNVIALLSKDFAKLVLLANIIALPVAWFAMNGWLENFAYRVEMSWWVFAAAGGAALFIALLTVSTQAVRAALVNPVESLHYE